MNTTVFKRLVHDMPVMNIYTSWIRNLFVAFCDTRLFVVYDIYLTTKRTILLCFPMAVVKRYSSVQRCARARVCVCDADGVELYSFDIVPYARSRARVPGSRHTSPTDVNTCLYWSHTSHLTVGCWNCVVLRAIFSRKR